jgi:hypothetical protein
MPGSWMSMPPEQWQAQQGGTIRLTLGAWHDNYGSWTLAGELQGYHTEVNVPLAGWAS